MKKIFNLFTHQLTGVFALVMLVGAAYGQCPTGQSNVDITYQTGGFNGENGWALVNTSTMPPSALACAPTGGAGPAAGVTSVCVPDGATIQLYAWETFGDGWCAPAMITGEITEDGSANGGCTFVGDALFAPMSAGMAVSGTGGMTCPPTAAQIGAAQAVGAAFTTGCSTCEITCPDDVTVSNDTGVCGAFFECPPPGFDPMGCNLETAINEITLNEVLQFADIPGFANGGFANFVGTYNVAFDLAPLCNFALPVCVDEICFDVTFQGDFDFITEQIIVTSPDLPGFLFDSDANGYVQCSVATTTVCLTPAQWETARGDCSLDFSIVATGTGVNTGLCAPLNGMQVAASSFTDCDVFATSVLFADGTMGLKPMDGVFPAGCNVVTYTGLGGTPIAGGGGMGGTGSGTGSGTTGGTGGGGGFGPPGIPIECSFNITVIDDEAPVISGPRDFTFNLQSGECCEIYDFEVTAVDNCPAEAFALANSFCDPCLDPQGGSALACGPGAPNSIITIINGASSGAGLSDVCFNQTTFDLAAVTTINLYCFDGVNVPFDGGAFTPFATATYDLDAANNGACVCVSFADPVTGELTTIPAGCSDIAVEISTAAGRIVETPVTCGGNAATGMNTYIVAPTCGIATPGTFANLGFVLDAGMSLNLIPPAIAAFPVDPPPGTFPGATTINGFEPGDALGVGVHCFFFESTDSAAGNENCDGTTQTNNTSTHSWCVTVNDVPNVTDNLTCDDAVNVSVDENCQVLITADMFLEGGPYSCLFDCYEVYIRDLKGNPVPASCIAPIKTDVDNGDVGDDLNGCTVSLECGTYIYEVFDACRDNLCWGEFTVEDKLAPVINAPADATITCVQSAEPRPDIVGTATAEFASVPIAAVGLSTTTGEITGIPTGAVVTDISVDVNLSHSWLADLDVTVTGPNGATVTLFSGQCGLDENAVATFDDVNGGPQACSAGTTQSQDCSDPAPTMATSALSGIFTTTNSDLTSTFAGTDPAGVWTLNINDNVGGDGGCLYSAAVNVSYILEGVEPATLATGISYVDADGNPVDADAPGAIQIGCDDDLVSFDELFEGACGESFIIRTWTATDDKGNQSSVEQRIDIETIGISGLGADWFWPSPVVTLNCNVDVSPGGIADFFREEFLANNICPDPLSCDEPSDPFNRAVMTAALLNAYPNTLGSDGNLDNFVDNSCDLNFTFVDNVLNVCGSDCPGNSKIIREWTVVDWCTQEVASFTQLIHARDVDGPEIDFGGGTNMTSMVAGAHPWGCVAEFDLPNPAKLTDNCSNTVDFTVTGPANVSFVPVEGTPGIWRVSGAPVGSHTYTYTASDCCGNESTGTVVVDVVDNSAPIPVATQNIVVGITFSPTNPNAAASKIFNYQIDNGSHDGSCSDNVRTAIRRIDGDCDNDNNNTFFNFADLPNNQQPEDHDRGDTDNGEFITFCCNDLLTGDGEDLDGDGVNDFVNITVELGVWDDADGDGWPGSTTGDLFSRTWATVRLEAKVNPVLVCPPDATIGCEVDERGDLALNTILGRASASTACGLVDVNFSDVCADDFNKACHYGEIERTWAIEGTSRSCVQIITINPPTTLFSGSYYLLDANGDYILNGSNPIENDNITFPFERDAVDINDDNFDDFSEVTVSCVDDLGNPEPTWVDTHCSLIGFSVDSDTINFEGDACRKIINEYCVIDWCQFDPSGESQHPTNGDMGGNTAAPGKWCWTVIGKLIDEVAPVITAENDMFPANPGAGGSGGFPTTPNCVGNASMTASAFDGFMDADGDIIDDACPSTWLQWVALVDLNNDWSFDFEWSSFIPEGDQPFDDTNGNFIPDVQVGEGFDSANGPKTGPGDFTINIPANIPADCGATQHRVEWTVYDGCGNVSSTTSYFTVQDLKAPTPFCINLSTAVMQIPAGGTADDAFVEVWAIDFDNGSFDNCTANDDLLFSFSDDASTVNPDFRSASMRFDCDALGGSDNALLTLPVYVWDGCGNRDFCLVNLRVVDNTGGCGNPSTGSLIAGTISTESGQMVENVEVMNEVMPGVTQDLTMTESNGEYAFYKQTRGNDYQLSGTKNDDYSNGVSTIDIVMIQRHILGIETFDSAYDMIAADVNNDQRIDGADLVELRKLVLGIYTELPQNDSWRFVDADKTLDLTSPWNFDETVEVMQLESDMLSENFIGVKVGDVSGDVVANAVDTPNVSNKASGAVTIDFDNVEVTAGQTVQLTVSANQADLYGYQFTLATPGLELVNVQAANLDVTEANFGVFGDVMTTSWNDSKPMNATGELFTLTYKSTVQGQLSDILDLNSNITNAEAYVGSNMDIVDVVLGSNAAVAEFALNQNEPNPFSANTTIGFVMAEAATATMTIYDVTGKVISVVTGDYPKGYNEIELSKSELGATGVLHYQLESGDFIATKKMIVIE